MKRKKHPPKRHQIVDQDGWTHVVKGPRSNKALIPIDRNEHSLTTVLDPLTIAAKHTEYGRRWRESEAYKQSAGFIQSTLLPLENLYIDCCICLGLGSFTMDEPLLHHGPDPRRALSQLVAFESWIELLKARFLIHRIIFQDPRFLHSDRQFLENQGYEVLEEPACEALVSSSTFLYASYTPIHVVPGFLGRAYPAVVICAGLEGLGEINLRSNESLRESHVATARHFCHARDNWTTVAFNRVDWMRGMIVHYSKDSTEVETTSEEESPRAEEA